MLNFDTQTTENTTIKITKLHTDKLHGAYSYKLILELSEGDTSHTYPMRLRPVTQNTINLIRILSAFDYSDTFLEALQTVIRIIVAILYSTDHSVYFT